MVKPGRVLYEIEGVDEKLAREAFHLAHHKLFDPDPGDHARGGAVMMKIKAQIGSIRESSNDELKDRVKRPGGGAVSAPPQALYEPAREYQRHQEHAAREIARSKSVLSAPRRRPRAAGRKGRGEGIVMAETTTTEPTTQKGTRRAAHPRRRGHLGQDEQDGGGQRRPTACARRPTRST